MSNSQIYVFGSECFKNVGDLHSTLYLNASCGDTMLSLYCVLLSFMVTLASLSSPPLYLLVFVFSLVCNVC